MIRGDEMEKDVSDSINALLKDNLKDKNLKVKKLIYTMDFGTTEVVIKLGLN